MITEQNLKAFNSGFIAGSKFECWTWTGLVSDNGYGKVWWDGHSEWAHRVSYIYHHDFCIIPPTIMVLHRCRKNRLCVNPYHLYLGTHAQNMLDAIRQGTVRDSAGQSNPRAILTNEDVRTIRSLKSAGYKMRDVYPSYENRIAENGFAKIWSGERWKHI